MASLIPLCVLLLLLWPLSRGSSAAEEEEVVVDVLVILPKNNSYLFSYPRVSLALQYAERRLRGADHPRGGGGGGGAPTFSMRYADSECGNPALFSLVDGSPQTRPDLILGPVCEYPAAAVARLASHWDIPMVTAGALAAAFSNKGGEYSHLTRVAPSYLKMAEAFAAMFQHFSWRSALLVYEDDKEERPCHFAVEAVYVLLNPGLLDHLHVHALSGARDERLDAEDLLQAVREAEVVIMCMGADMIREMMLAAHRRRLTDGSTVYFNIELFNTSSYGDGSWKRGDKLDTEARQAYASLHTVTLLKTVKPEFENFSMEINRSIQKDSFADCQDCGSVNMFLEGFHDGLLLYAIALQEAMRKGFSKKDGAQITAHMWNRTFEGIAGPVSMDANGDREQDFSVMAMTRPEVGAYEVVANYFALNGSFQVLPAVDTDRFTPRGRREPLPPTPEKSYGLGVSALTGIIVGALLGTALLMAFYFFRKNYRISIDRRTRLEECDIGKHRQLREDSIRSNFSAA